MPDDFEIDSAELRFCVFGKNFKPEYLREDLRSEFSRSWSLGDLRRNGKSFYKDGGVEIVKSVFLCDVGDEILNIIENLFEIKGVHRCVDCSGAYFSISLRDRDFFEFF